MEKNEKTRHLKDINEMYGKFLKELKSNTSEEGYKNISDQIEQLIDKVTKLKNIL